MMTLRQRLFIIISLVVVIILVILLFLNYRRKQGDIPAIGSVIEGTSETASETGASNEEDLGLGSNTKEAVPYSEDLYIRQLAKIFVERFASQSTQNDNGHIDDTLELASPSMRAWMNKQVKPNSADYEGVITSIFASKLTEKTDTTATVTVQAQQKWERKAANTVGAVTHEDKRRNGRVTFVKVDGKWLVDGLFWDKE